MQAGRFCLLDSIIKLDFLLSALILVLFITPYNTIWHHAASLQPSCLHMDVTLAAAAGAAYESVMTHVQDNKV